jgi:hypothetical protein
VFRYREERRVWRFEEPDTYRERGVVIERIERSARPLHDRQKWTELDFDTISECSRADHTGIEWMKKASENGDFDLTKVGWTPSVSWVARRKQVKEWMDIGPVWGQICEMDRVFDIEIDYA